MIHRGLALFATWSVISLACSSEVTVDTSASQSSVASTTASTSGGGGSPFGSGGSPGDPCLEECGSVSEPSGCLLCALESDDCQEDYALCLADPTCLAFEQCNELCSNVACTQHCRESYPEGAPIYESLFYCLNCVPMHVRCSIACNTSVCTIP